MATLALYRAQPRLPRGRPALDGGLIMAMPTVPGRILAPEVLKLEFAFSWSNWGMALWQWLLLYGVGGTFWVLDFVGGCRRSQRVYHAVLTRLQA